MTRGPGRPCRGPAGRSGVRGVAHDVRPGQHRVTQPCLRLPVHVDEDTPGVRIAHARRGVRVPGEGRTPGAATRLVVGAVRTCRRVVGLLGLPGDDAVLDVHLPRTGAGAVHAVGGADYLVVAPPVAVEHVPAPSPAPEDGPPVIGLVPSREEPAGAQEHISRWTVESRGILGHGRERINRTGGRTETNDPRTLDAALWIRCVAGPSTPKQ
jgi:hypothetical protein